MSRHQCPVADGVRFDAGSVDHVCLFPEISLAQLAFACPGLTSLALRRGPTEHMTRKDVTQKNEPPAQFQNRATLPNMGNIGQVAM